MATAIRVEVLPARLGDCLLIECVRPRRRPWRMLVDGGPPDTWPLLAARLDRLPASGPTIDVAVITHIDSDHIGGMIPFLGSDFARDHVRDVWFNGRPHLAAPRRAPKSVTQGEAVGATLAGAPGAPPGMPWNLAFAGGAIATPAAPGFGELQVPEGPKITVLSPNPPRLAALAKVWFAALDKALHPPQERPAPDLPGPLGDLTALAARRTAKDATAPNGSSIALLVEHRGASVLLGADAFGPVLASALQALAQARGIPAVEVDALKLPHHGSQANVLTDLITAAPARHYLVSSNGDTFGHPDDPAIARVVTAAPRGATLWFNYRNARTERWADPALTAAHGYAVRFPAAPDTGTVLALPAR